MTVASTLLKTNSSMRPSSPAEAVVKPPNRLPGSPYAVATTALKPKGRVRPPSPANFHMKPEPDLPGSPLCGRHLRLEAHDLNATAEPGHSMNETQAGLAGLALLEAT